MKARTINTPKLIAAYGLGEDKLSALAAVCDKENIILRPVGEHEAGCTVGYLCGHGGALPTGEVHEPAKEECLIFSGFDRQSLSDVVDKLRKAGAAVALKAVCTPSNRSWTLSALLRELAAEHAYMTGKGGAK